MPDRKRHWETVYRQKHAEEVSWYQAEPELSLRLIANAALSKDAEIIDVGGGVSRLSARLCARGYQNLSVLDISANALDQSRKLLGTCDCRLRFIEQDITEFEPPGTFDLWHDRAVFHFLTDRKDREAYVSVLERALAPGSHLVILTFAADGPKKCSGLEVTRYGRTEMQAVLGRNFRLEEHGAEMHTTPSGGRQKFAYFRFTYQPRS